MSHPIKLSQWICFDWDGTLIDSTTRNFNALKMAVDSICIDTTATTIKKICESTSLQSPDWNLLFKKIPISKKSIKAIKKEWRKNILFMPIADLFLDVKDVLSILSKKYDIGIVTSAERWRLNLEIQYHNLQHLINGSICSDEVSQQKPLPEPLREFIRKYKGEIRLFIGDHIDDMNMATAAGVDGCMIIKNSLITPPPTHPFLQVHQLVEIMQFI